MSLVPGRSQKAVSKNIKELIEAGNRPKQRKADGGGIAGMPTGPEDMIAELHPGGKFSGAGSGRGDTMQATVPEDSYIIPADIVSALGDGNTEAGSKVLDNILGIDRQAAPQGTARPVPILVSSGEYQVPPEEVARLGGGDVKQGQDILDAFVENIRAKNINKLKKIPGPKK